MFDILLTVLPVFLVMGAGYLAVRTHYVSETIADGLNSFAAKIAVPMLLFAAMLRLDFSAAFHIPMLVGFYVGAFTCFAAGILLARIVWKRRPGESVAIGFGATFSNTVLLGLPIMQQAFGEDALAPAFAIISLHASSIYAVGMITMELSRRDGRPLGQTLAAAAKSILANVLMIAILCGIALNLLGVELPVPIMSAVDIIAAAALPAALVGIGAALTRYQLTARFSESLTISLLALFIHPAIAFAITHLMLGLPIEFVRAAVILAAMPPGVNIYIFASIYDRGVDVAASTLVLSNLLSVVTITLWLYVVAML